MKKVEWIAEDIFFDELGRLNILNPELVERIKRIRHFKAPIQINENSVIVGPIPVPGPRNPICPDAMCICRPGWLDPIRPREQTRAMKARTKSRARKPTTSL